MPVHTQSVDTQPPLNNTNIQELWDRVELSRRPSTYPDEVPLSRDECPRSRSPTERKRCARSERPAAGAHDRVSVLRNLLVVTRSLARMTCADHVYELKPRIYTPLQFVPARIRRISTLRSRSGEGSFGGFRDRFTCTIDRTPPDAISCHPSLSSAVNAPGDLCRTEDAICRHDDVIIRGRV